MAVVAHRPEEERDLVLLTRVPITTAAAAQLVYDQWPQRSGIEHTYRFHQEAGLDVEELPLHSSLPPSILSPLANSVLGKHQYEKH